MQLSVFDRAVYSGEFRGGKEEMNFYDQPIAKLPSLRSSWWLKTSLPPAVVEVD